MAENNQSGGKAFTGRTRARTPKKSVIVADRVARWVISLGGIGSIIAVSLVGLFLFYVVVPLFPVSYTHLTLPTTCTPCWCRWGAEG